MAPLAGAFVPGSRHAQQGSGSHPLQLRGLWREAASTLIFVCVMLLWSTEHRRLAPRLIRTIVPAREAGIEFAISELGGIPEMLNVSRDELNMSSITEQVSGFADLNLNKNVTDRLVKEYAMCAMQNEEEFCDREMMKDEVRTRVRARRRAPSPPCLAVAARRRRCSCRSTAR